MKKQIVSAAASLTVAVFAATVALAGCPEAPAPTTRAVSAPLRERFISNRLQCVVEPLHRCVSRLGSRATGDIQSDIME